MKATSNQLVSICGAIARTRLGAASISVDTLRKEVESKGNQFGTAFDTPKREALELAIREWLQHQADSATVANTGRGVLASGLAFRRDRKAEINPYRLVSTVRTDCGELIPALQFVACLCDARKSVIREGKPITSKAKAALFKAFAGLRAEDWKSLPVGVTGNKAYAERGFCGALEAKTIMSKFAESQKEWLAIHAERLEVPTVQTAKPIIRKGKRPAKQTADDYAKQTVQSSKAVSANIKSAQALASH